MHHPAGHEHRSDNGPSDEQLERVPCASSENCSSKSDKEHPRKDCLESRLNKFKIGSDDDDDDRELGTSATLELVKHR